MRKSEKGSPKVSRDSGVGPLTNDASDHLYVTIVERDEEAKLLRTWGIGGVSVESLGLSWRNEIPAGVLEFFRGQRLFIILGDHALKQSIATQLLSVAAWVKVVDLPQGDIISWSAVPGNNVEALALISVSSPQWSQPKVLVPAEVHLPVVANNRTHSYLLDQKGLYVLRDFDEEHQGPQRLCDPILVAVELRDRQSNNWMRLLVFLDRCGSVHEVPVPMNWFNGTMAKVTRLLLDSGFTVPRNKKDREALLLYLHYSPPARSTPITVVHTIGWHGDSFVLPGHAIGPQSEDLKYVGNNACAVSQRGSLAEWRKFVAFFCQGNSRLVFSVSSAFAGLLVEPMGFENGGFHFRGVNGIGKSSIFFAGVSVMGGPEVLQRWRTTSNGLEQLAMSHNNLLLVLDELAQIDPREAGAAAYMLGNGAAKVRMTGSRGEHWRLLFLSSGEVSLAEHMQSGKKQIMGGQEDRLPEIPANAGKGHGVFETIHGFRHGGELSDLLRANAAEYYGTPLLAFLESLTSDLDTAKAFIRQKIDEFIETFVPPGALSKVGRVAKRFGLVAAAGELATHYGITGWPEGEAMRGAGSCFRAWLDTKHPSVTDDGEALLGELMAFVTEHKDRFADLETKKLPGKDHAGYRRAMKDGNTEYFVEPKCFRDEVFAGRDANLVCKQLSDMGVLRTGGNGHLTRLQRVPGRANPCRFYVVIVR